MSEERKGKPFSISQMEEEASHLMSMAEVKKLTLPQLLKFACNAKAIELTVAWKGERPTKLRLDILEYNKPKSMDSDNRGIPGR
jgi:hypothetical protein